MKFKISFSILLIAIFPVSRISAQSTGNTSPNLEMKILLEIAEDRTEGQTKFYHTISDLSKPVSIALPVSTMLVGLITHDKDLKKKAIYLAESFVVNTAITHALKAIINRSRPFVTHPELVPLEFQRDYSFPSGHSSEAFSMATSLSISFPKWYVIAPAFTFASLVGYSRLYLGVHYPSDVLAGALLGSGTAWLTYKANQWLNKGHTRRKSHIETY